MTALEQFKEKYKPLEGYSFVIGVDPYNDEATGKLYASVFKKILIKDKKEGEYVMEASILNVKDTYNNFVKILAPYIEAR